MLYTFSDWDMLQNSDFPVYILAGETNIFANAIASTQRNKCRGELANIKISEDLLREFGLPVDADANSAEVSADFNQFCSVAYSPSITGKWFCSVEYEQLDANKLKKLNEYMSNPSQYAVLVVYMRDFRQFMKLQKDPKIKRNSKIAYINLSYPPTAFLKSFVSSLFKGRGQTINNDARELFIAKLGNHYDDYSFMADKFYMYTDTAITYQDVASVLKDVENYVLDDFMLELTKVISKDTKTNKKIYKIVRSLLSEMDINKLLSMIHYKAVDLCNIRLYINKGYIPIGFQYSVAEVQERLPENSRLKTMSKHTFSKLVSIASRSSLQDWLYIQQLTSLKSYSPISGLRILHLLIHRDLFTQEVLRDAITN